MCYQSDFVPSFLTFYPPDFVPSCHIRFYPPDFIPSFPDMVTQQTSPITLHIYPPELVPSDADAACHEYLYRESGELMSFGYQLGMNYQNYENCSWTIFAPEDLLVHLWFVDFDVEDSDSCLYDKVILDLSLPSWVPVLTLELHVVQFHWRNNSEIGIISLKKLRVQMLSANRCPEYYRGVWSRVQNTMSGSCPVEIGLAYTVLQCTCVYMTKYCIYFTWLRVPIRPISVLYFACSPNKPGLRYICETSVYL